MIINAKSDQRFQISAENVAATCCIVLYCIVQLMYCTVIESLKNPGLCSTKSNKKEHQIDAKI